MRAEYLANEGIFKDEIQRLILERDYPHFDKRTSVKVYGGRTSKQDKNYFEFVIETSNAVDDEAEGTIHSTAYYWVKNNSLKEFNASYLKIIIRLEIFKFSGEVFENNPLEL